MLTGESEAEAIPTAMGEMIQEQERQERHCPLISVLQIVMAYITDNCNNNNATLSSKGAVVHLTL